MACCGLQSSRDVRPRPRRGRMAPRPVTRIDPRKLTAVLAVAFMLNGAVLAWRYASMRAAPPTTYFEFQVRRWEEQLASKPDDPAIWATLGSLQERAGNLSAARKAYRKALELDKESSPALAFFAREARKEGRLDEAASLYRRALKKLPQGSRAVIYYELGEIERERGDTASAIKMYEASIADNGTYFNAYQRLAFLYYDQGRKPEALWAAERAELLSGKQLQDVAALARSLRSAGTTYTEESIGR